MFYFRRIKTPLHIQSLWKTPRHHLCRRFVPLFPNLQKNIGPLIRPCMTMLTQLSCPRGRGSIPRPVCFLRFSTGPPFHWNDSRNDVGLSRLLPIFRGCLSLYLSRPKIV